jgi:hypothetical protein
MNAGDTSVSNRAYVDAIAGSFLSKTEDGTIAGKPATNKEEAVPPTEAFRKRRREI